MTIEPLYPITFLRTNNMKATRRFYEQILGLSVALEQKGCMIFKVGRYGYWGFCENTKETVEKAELVCLTIVVSSIEEVEAWHKHLVDSGVKVARAPEKNDRYNIFNGFYIDPSGYTLEIQYFYEIGEPKGHREYLD